MIERNLDRFYHLNTMIERNLDRLCSPNLVKKKDILMVFVALQVKKTIDRRKLCYGRD